MDNPKNKEQLKKKKEKKEEKKQKKTSKKEKEDREKRIREEAETRAQEKIYLEKVRKEEEKKAKQKEKEKSKRDNELYYFSFKYQIEDYAGNKIFQFTDFDGKKNKQYEIIKKKDKVLYINDEHPNHLKKGIVTKINARQSINKVYFTVVFDDPPFVWEYNSRTGEKIRTNKKIKVIEEINFKNLRKVGNKLQTDKANSVRLTNIDKNTVNLRNFLNSPWIHRGYNLQQNNILLIFYQVILFILSLKISTHQFSSQYFSDTEKKILKENAPKFEKFSELKGKDGNLKKKFEVLFKKKPYMKGLILNKLDIRKDEYVKDFITFFNLSKKTCELLFKDSQNIIDLKKQDNITQDDKNFLLNSSHRVNKTEEKIRIQKLKQNAMKYFEILFNNILPDKGNLKNLESFGIYSDLDKIKFIKNIQNKKDDIEEKNIMTHEKRIEFMLEKRINEIFHIRRQIFPEVVKFKYSGKSNEEENTLITDPEKLVAPSESKIFKLNQVPVPVKVTQENDYELDENGKKQLKEKIFKITKIGSNTSPGEIEVFLKFSVNVETEKTPEEILEESKKSPTLRLIQSFMSSIKNKLNCTKSKLDFYENLHQIAKMIEPVKEFTIDDDDDNSPTYDMHTKFIKTTPTTTVVTNKIISRDPIEITSTPAESTSSTPAQTTASTPAQTTASTPAPKPKLKPKKVIPPAQTTDYEPSAPPLIKWKYNLEYEGKQGEFKEYTANKGDIIVHGDEQNEKLKLIGQVNADYIIISNMDGSNERKVTADHYKLITEPQVKPVISIGEKEQKEQKVPILNPESKEDLICPHCKKTKKNIHHYNNCVKKCKEEKKQAEDATSGGGRKTVKLRLKKKNRTLKKI
tara:strand:- start:31572 stop:34145 length:2574 start_codon:yes stop_codon:yes gene_type:complete